MESNREFGDGRLDIVIYPEIFQDKAIVIECKHSKNADYLLKDSQEAIKQIHDNHYLEGVLEKGYQDVVGYGISFFKKQCYITKININ